MKKLCASVFSLLLLLHFVAAQDRSLPIGVFDSGTGGLTILNTIIKHEGLSGEKYIYLADQANMPYGNYYKENKTDLLKELVMKDVEFLQSKNVKTIVIACNTATAYAFDDVQAKLKKKGIRLKVIGVINAGAKGVLETFGKTENGSIGVFATAGTVASKGYERTILAMKKDLGYSGNIQVFSQGGYGLAEAVDEEPDFINRAATAPMPNYRGPSLDHAEYRIEKALMDVYDFNFDHNQMLCDSRNTDDCQVLQINSGENYVRYHLVSMMEKIRKTPGALPLKALVLGCTHYPYLDKEIRGTLLDLYNYQKDGKYIYRPFMQEKINIIDPAENVATELYAYLKSSALLTAKGDTALTEFYITVPNDANKKVPLDSAGRFTYDYKYGRSAGVNRNDVKTVPFSNDNISKETYERFRTSIPETYRLISAYQKFLAMQPAFAAADTLYRRYAERYRSPGMVYAVVADGKVVHTGSIGLGNIEKKYAAGPETAFRIASMSKSFAGMAILQLRDAGKLRLDDPAYLYIPELKDQKFPSADAAHITIRNLLTHSAGFPEDNPWGDRQLGISEEEMLDMFQKGISFSNNPGIAYEYSNMGFAMLGHIIKKVSGQSYQEYINDNIFKPLGMNDTYWEYTKVPEKQLALGYRFVNGTWVKQPMEHDGAYGIMGGLITTLTDFQKYLAVHLSSWPPSDDTTAVPLRRSSIREMHKPWQYGSLNAQARYPGGRTCAMVSGYGYGLRWQSDCEGRVSVGHSGGLPGFGSNWTIMPDYGIGVICFSNVTYAPTTMMNIHVLDTLISLAKLKPREVPVSAILKQRKDELVRLLPDWKNAESSGIFAENFFLDYFVDSLRRECTDIFRNAGKIKNVSAMRPFNNLRGSFLMEGDKSDVEIFFTLSPENPPLIQQFDIRNRPKK